MFPLPFSPPAFGPGHHAEIDALTARFRANEASSRVIDVAPEGQYVVIRCDGVRANKRFLSQQLQNARFADALSEATRSACLLFHRFAPEDAGPYVAGAALMSDEVSFVVNRGANYHGRRIWKMATTLCGALSGAMSVYLERAVRAAGEPVGRYAQIVNFDARPLVLPDAATVDAYLRWRRLLATRNAMAKSLRLAGICSAAELYESRPRKADDVLTLARLVEQGARWEDVGKALSTLSLLAFDEKRWLQTHPLPAAPLRSTWSSTSIWRRVPGPMAR